MNIFKNDKRNEECKMARKRKEEKIVRIQFAEDWTMLFGNSYDTWDEQLQDYLCMLKDRKQIVPIQHVSVSDEKWVAWGGLKWCSEENFQNQLNREGCQMNDDDNPNPRQYDSMRFYNDYDTAKKAETLVSNYLRRQEKLTV